MLRILLAGMVACITLSSVGQAPEPVKYRDMMFSNVVIRKNLSYATSLPAGVKKRSYLFDLFEPEGDSSAVRPLIIWMHGGGFKFGSKKIKGIPLWSKSFAQRGYVCAAINYRLSKKNTLSSFPELVKACSDAVEDAHKATVYFKENHNVYRIDTNRIILAGNSAGGIIALHAAYSSRNDMLRLIHVPDVSHAPGVYNPAGIAAVINFWGAIFSTEWLKNTRVPIVSVHGRKDRIVPIDHKSTPLHGSRAIHIKADSLNIVNSIKIYERFAHELQRHFNPLFAGRSTKRRWLEAGQFAADFLYNNLYR